MKKAVIIFTLIFAGSTSSFLQAQGGKWEVVKTKNTAANCSECGFATVNDRIYLIGGDGGTLRPVQCFDPKTLSMDHTGQYTADHCTTFRLCPIKTKYMFLMHFRAEDSPDQVPMANVYCFDTKTNIWEKGGEIPADRRRAGAAAVEYKGKMYLIAGITNGHSSGPTAMFDCYDPETKILVFPA